MKDNPVLIELEILNYCNYSCIYCYNEQKKPAKLNISDAKKLKSLFLELKIYKLVLTGGEPTLHPDFFNLLKIFGDVAYISIFTNGTKLETLDNNSSIKEIILSIPCANDKIYRELTKNNISFIKNKLENFKDKSKIIAHVVVNKLNIKQIENTVSFAVRTGLQSISFAPIRASQNDSFSLNELVLDNEDYIFLLNKLKALKKKYSSIYIHIPTPIPFCMLEKTNTFNLVPNLKKCNPGVGWCVVDYELNVRSCPHSFKIVGNLKQKKFQKIWNRMFSCQPKTIPASCKKCTYLNKCGICKENVDIKFK